MSAYTMLVTCPHCGHDLDHRAAGRATDQGRRISSVAQCTRTGCRREWLVVAELHPFRDVIEVPA